jgi:hypothetical protein
MIMMVVTVIVMIMVAIAFAVMMFFMIVVIMIVVMVVMFVQMVIYAAVFQSIYHYMFQGVSVHFDHGGHEIEIHFLLRREHTVLLNAVLNVREVKRDALSFRGVYRCLYVPEQRAGLFLHPFAGGEQRVGETGGNVRIIAVYVPREAHSDTACLLYRCSLRVVLFFFTIVAVAVFVVMGMFVVMVAHCIIS